MIDKHCQNYCRNDKKLNAERIVYFVVSSLELNVHQIDSAQRWNDIKYLHSCVIQRYEVCEQIQIACQEHQCKKDLTATRNALKMIKIISSSFSFLIGYLYLNWCLPEHDLVRQILESKIRIANKCDKSPVNLNMFII